jgi:hypothetical protein
MDKAGPFDQLLPACQLYATTRLTSRASLNLLPQNSTGQDASATQPSPKSLQNNVFPIRQV